MSDTVVIYHGGCIDGFTAAWAAWTKHMDDAEYVPATHGDSPPEVAGRDVLIVDFSYPRNVLIRMHDEAKTMLVLDHHKTAQEDLEGLDFAVFDMERSGAGLAWDWAHGVERPWLVDYVEDRDLWRFALPRSREVNAYISTLKQDFVAWSDALEEGPGAAEDKGGAVLRYIDRYVDAMCQHAVRITLYGHDVPAVNAPYINTSELVGALADGEPFAVGWFQRGDGRFQYSLRSRSGIDVSEVARKYGGGGHPGAAGFIVDCPVHDLAVVQERRRHG